MVYALFCINSAGGVIGYFLADKLSLNRGTLHRVAALRCVLTLLLIAAEVRQGYSTILTAITLFLLGLAYAIFHILSLSMEVLPEGMAGIFNVTECLGGALGFIHRATNSRKTRFHIPLPRSKPNLLHLIYNP
ncbi:MAG: hypothetical protein QXM87_09150 [Candidatus Bathyarchaeia archaeon]